MTVFLSILGAVVVLGVLIVIHELGHFGAARALGFRVDEFAVGFGPRVLSKERKGILYSLRAFPLGGFCRFHGEDQDKREDPTAFNAQKAWKRFLVILAGSAMNIAFAYVLAVVTLMAWGDYAATVETVNAGSPAEAAGMRPGDVIVSVNGKQAVFDFSALGEIQKADPEAGVEVVVKRGGEYVALRPKNLFDDTQGKNQIGITINYEGRRSFTFGEALGTAGEFLAYSAKTLLNFFANIFRTPNLQDQVMGPVGTISVIGQAVRTGWESIFRLTLYLSLNLGIFNLLPFPALDGARLIFLLIEIIFGKPVPREKEGLVHLVGLGLLMAFVLYLTIGDVGRLIGG
ncbi:MAG: M50 family metallopeptidase [Christensenellales bacterium]|jgi:regulator of sigma E protease